MTPLRSRPSKRGSASSINASSLALRVAFTVERMPPP
ncbi:Uncharacterised protein [Vibrio cholerae]|nr:Uncharacterised protein [Vibrio cholerae]CSC69007.1 Uncharacterised protein [Vibrio cholerae]CSI89253.1 Uncharacterised protein [Vibrio cholerae]